MRSTSGSLLEAFDPQVTAFATADYALSDDLLRLDQVRAVGAIEAIVFYSSRIMEVQVRAAMRQMLQEPSENLSDDLMQLRTYGGLTGDQLRWMHQLRALGNIARHAVRRLSLADADLAFVLVLRWLHWYFCVFGHEGKKLRALTYHTQQFASLLPAGVNALLDRLDAANIEAEDFVTSLRLDEKDCEWLLTAVVPAVLAERLLDRGRHEQASAVLSSALKQFPGDLRLRQLQGLYLSSTGQLDQARKILEAIRPTGTPVDEETLGILAGVYKRYWKKEPHKGQWLMKCHENYRQGWDRSQRTNTYLGINAAFTALCLEQGGKARTLAAELAELLDKRLEQRASVGGLNYWDQVTLAEALLYGDPPRALELYRDAFTRFKEQERNLQVTRDQAKEVMKRLGLDPGTCP